MLVFRRPSSVILSTSLAGAARIIRFVTRVGSQVDTGIMVGDRVGEREVLREQDHHLCASHASLFPAPFFLSLSGPFSHICPIDLSPKLVRSTLTQLF
jgi:hypothetical protein